jgi:hypothetical protein
MVVATRTDGTTAWVKSNASSAANTYCNANRAIKLEPITTFPALNMQSRLRRLRFPVNPLIDDVERNTLCGRYAKADTGSMGGFRPARREAVQKSF